MVMKVVISCNRLLKLRHKFVLGCDSISVLHEFAPRHNGVQYGTEDLNLS